MSLVITTTPFSLRHYAWDICIVISECWFWLPSKCLQNVLLWFGIEMKSYHVHQKLAYRMRKHKFVIKEANMHRCRDNQLLCHSETGSLFLYFGCASSLLSKLLSSFGNWGLRPNTLPALSKAHKLNTKVCCKMRIFPWICAFIRSVEFCNVILLRLRARNSP